MNINFFYLKRGIAAVVTLLAAVFFILHLVTYLTAMKYAKQISAAPVDYSQAENWLSLDGRGGEKPVDVFFLYPTCYFVDKADFCPIDDPDMRSEAQKLRDAHSGIFDHANFFAPYYRQLSIPYIKKTMILNVLDKAVEVIPLADCKIAFEYYLQNDNHGKPIIFASHSQGTVVMKELLVWMREKHPQVLDRTIAAYLIGFALNEKYVKKTGLDFARGSNDTGVIISYNTESPAAKYNPFLFMRRGTLAINPINWKKDETHAPKDESLGSHVRFGDTVPVDCFNFADARLNLKRGSVVTNADINDAYWAVGVLHRYDYDLFYYDLQHNVRTRIAAFLGNLNP
ncbi:MAG: DUF3089 domain-containing protein [Spirochaetaceae bacterium]|jgi:hypothetical protein|nr:DUF3089 domain-containing protein [Spirochaetaceae bacterium]